MTYWGRWNGFGVRFDHRSAFVGPENETLVEDVLLLLHSKGRVEGGRGRTVRLRDKKQLCLYIVLSL